MEQAQHQPQPQEVEVLILPCLCNDRITVIEPVLSDVNVECCAKCHKILAQARHQEVEVIKISCWCNNNNRITVVDPPKYGFSVNWCKTCHFDPASKKKQSSCSVLRSDSNSTITSHYLCNGHLSLYTILCSFFMNFHVWKYS